MTEAAQTPATPKVQRRRRASVGGMTLKLDAKTRPGFVRRWFNGDPSRLAEARELGYDFVTEEAGEGKARSDSVGTRISRHVGSNKKGEPIQAYLMETPVEEYQAGRDEIESHAKALEEAINRGADTTGQLENAYRTSDKSSISHNG